MRVVASASVRTSRTRCDRFAIQRAVARLIPVAARAVPVRRLPRASLDRREEATPARLRQALQGLGTPAIGATKSSSPFLPEAVGSWAGVCTDRDEPVDTIRQHRQLRRGVNTAPSESVCGRTKRPHSSSLAGSIGPYPTNVIRFGMSPRGPRSAVGHQRALCHCGQADEATLTITPPNSSLTVTLVHSHVVPGANGDRHWPLAR